MAEMEPLKIPLAVEHTTIDDVSVWSGLALRTMEEPKRLNGSPLTLRSQVDWCASKKVPYGQHRNGTIFEKPSQWNLWLILGLVAYCPTSKW